MTCNTVDDKGNTASATTSVTVIAPPPPPVPPAPTASSLCSVSFERDAKRPTRVDNEAKACLDDIALSCRAPPMPSWRWLATKTPRSRRSMRGKRRCTQASEAELRGGARGQHQGLPGDGEGHRSFAHLGLHRRATTKTVTTTLIPAGATLNTAGDTPVDESAVKAVPRNPVPVVKKARKKTS